MSSNYSFMQTDQPYKSYVKRCLGKLQVHVLDPFPPGEPVSVILYGDPRKPTPDCIVDVWSEKENLYFLRANKKHFDTGDLGLYTYPEPAQTEEEKINSMSDDALRSLLDERFYSLKNTIAKMTAVTPLHVLLTFAKEAEKSEKIIKLIESRISELQEEEIKDFVEQE